MPAVELTPSQIAFIKQNCLDSIHFLDQIMARPEAGERALPYLRERRIQFKLLYDDLNNLNNPDVGRTKHVAPGHDSG